LPRKDRGCDSIEPRTVLDFPSLYEPAGARMLATLQIHDSCACMCHDCRKAERHSRNTVRHVAHPRKTTTLYTCTIPCSSTNLTPSPIGLALWNSVALGISSLQHCNEVSIRNSGFELSTRDQSSLAAVMGTTIPVDRWDMSGYHHGGHQRRASIQPTSANRTLTFAIVAQHWDHLWGIYLPRPQICT
jgi:hypothetical protein